MLEIGRNIPTRVERLEATFESDELARVIFSESRGSEYSYESLTSDLVKSFMEKCSVRAVIGEEDAAFLHDKENRNFKWYDYSEKKEILQEIFGFDEVKETIRRETELAIQLVAGDKSSPGYKRLIMSCLREKGFDAGLCKTKSERKGRFHPSDYPSDYEFIDVNYGQKRYIVEISLMSEFEIARPTNQYSSLLDVFPLVFVGKVKELRKVVRLMCTAMKYSMKTMDMPVPPWRRNSYMQAKWRNPYERTANEIAFKSSNLKQNLLKLLKLDI